MRRRKDGSIQASSIPTAQNISYSYNNFLYRCMVTKVIFVDKDNITTSAANPRVLYDCVVLGGWESGQTLSNCRLASDLGGIKNFNERVLTPTSKNLTKVKLQDHDGDIVYILFNQGNSGFPVIIALDHGIKQLEAAATQDDGIRSLSQFNGVREEINKVGEYIFTRQGGTVPKDRFVAEEEVPQYKLEIIDPQTKIETYRSGLIIEEDGLNDIITISFDTGLTVIHDGKNDKVKVTTNKGTSTDIDGPLDKITFTTASGANVVIDGPGNKITLTHGSTIIDLDAASGKIFLTGGLIDVGAAVSDLAVLFTELVSAHNSHTHPFAHPPFAGVSSAPSAPMPPQVSSGTVRLQP